MRRVLTMMAVLAVAGQMTWAAELAGVSMPDTVTIGDSELVLNGMGVRKKLWVKVYVAGLYLEAKTTDAADALEAPGPKKVIMHFLTDKATKKKMDEAWREGFEANSPGSGEAMSTRIEKFIGTFGDMKTGDVIELTIVPKSGTTAELNGQSKGTIEGDDFGRALLAVWLGNSPPTEDLKTGMLGG